MARRFPGSRGGGADSRGPGRPGAGATGRRRSQGGWADLADMAGGTYFGDVISDSRGQSRAHVRLTVARAGPEPGPGDVRLSEAAPLTARLGRVMDTLQNVGGDAVFLLDLSKRPPTLMVTVDDASWAGSKEWAKGQERSPRPLVPSECGRVLEAVLIVDDDEFAVALLATGRRSAGLVEFGPGEVLVAGAAGRRVLRCRLRSAARALSHWPRLP